MPNSKPRAVLYLRLSSADDASTSIHRQERDLRRLAKQEGWEVVSVLTDNGISGTKNRANAETALAMLKDGDADVLAVWKLDRWSRQGLGALGELINALDAKSGSLFVALKDGLRSDQPTWKIIAAVLSEVAAMEAENTKLRVKSSQTTLKTSGRYSGGRVPFGYTTAPNPSGAGRVLVPEPAEADEVRKLAERVTAGESLVKIAKDLNDRGVPTAMSEARRQARAGAEPVGSSGEWRVTTLKVLLTSPHILGRVTIDGAVVTGDDGLPKTVFEPLVDASTYAALRARLDGADPVKRKRRAARLLSGVAYCVCGRKMYVRKGSNGKPIYGCSAGADGANCPAPRIAAEALEDHVAEAFLHVAGEVPEYEEVTVAHADAGKLADVEQTIRDTTAALGSDDADLPALLARLKDLKTLRADLRRSAETVEIVTRPTGRTMRAAWEASDVDGRRSVLLAVMDHVTIAPRTERLNKFDPRRVDIKWIS